MKIIDLRSDTVTVPTDEMRRAMYQAEVGDDVYSEDPTINRLEEISAEMMGKEAALFTASGTMSNLIAILAQTSTGDEVVVGSEAHTFWYELGGASALGGVLLRTVPNEEDGRIIITSFEQAIRTDDIHFPPTTLLCLENTHNRCGGTVLTVEYTKEIADVAHQHHILVHLDGARIFNAAVALNVPVRQLAAQADSVCFCISKGLAAPVGSLLCGSSQFIQQARRLRKMLGGGMRQAGILAAAGIVALEKMVTRLADDHTNARRLATGLAEIPGMSIEPEKYPTNIIVFGCPRNIPETEFNHSLQQEGILCNPRGNGMFRMVTHYLISTQDIDDVLVRISRIVKNRPVA